MLIGAVRSFVQTEAQLGVIAAATPMGTEEDAHAQLAEVQGPPFGSFALNGQITDVTEVTPPQEAGEHARAFLTTITSSSPRRSMAVAWVEPRQPMFVGIAVAAPAALDLSESASVLIQRQRKRLAQAALP
jgi:hypothetical protein